MKSKYSPIIWLLLLSEANLISLILPLVILINVMIFDFVRWWFEIRIFWNKRKNKWTLSSIHFAKHSPCTSICLTKANNFNQIPNFIPIWALSNALHQFKYFSSLKHLTPTVNQYPAVDCLLLLIWKIKFVEAPSYYFLFLIEMNFQMNNVTKNFQHWVECVGILPITVYNNYDIASLAVL